jgi:hypothetical protein
MGAKARISDEGQAESGGLDDRAGDPPEQMPDDAAKSHEIFPENEEDVEHDPVRDSNRGPGADVKRAVGARFVAHGEKVKEKGAGGKGESYGWP